MATVKLGQRPKSFKRTVRFPMLDGSEGAIEVVYKYRTRREFGAFLDEIMAAAGVEPTTGEDGKQAFSMAALQSATVGRNADYVLQIAEGWNLDGQEFGREAIEQLADEVPAAVTAIMESYRAAIVEGRLGN